MSLHLQPVQLATGSEDSESHLVFADGLLVAILVHLSDMHEEDAGKWYLEAVFGPTWGREHPSFVDLDAAQAWIASRLGASQTH
ncbi:hypothetical protein [Methylobacterium sp. Leaf117]|uniref:hypothetical protein n=1 Tax=Methylobacterium sp. Leaf117 TaxID=1736260 RepID=UPI0006F4F4BD|nr:hypothetical protein [Methylobacterium sp. Leaf117]KQP89391.1 hypothetical protein ASF57_23825 [Methylobacterium sp. Leaf117]